jgi:hypothetical protein
VLIPGSIDDIVALVRFARAHRLQIAANGQAGTDDLRESHSSFGQAQVDAGIAIDMSPLDDVFAVDGRRIDVGAGAQWSDVFAFIFRLDPTIAFLKSIGAWHRLVATGSTHIGLPIGGVTAGRTSAILDDLGSISSPRQAPGAHHDRSRAQSPTLGVPDQSACHDAVVAVAQRVGGDGDFCVQASIASSHTDQDESRRGTVALHRAGHDLAAHVKLGVAAELGLVRRDLLDVVGAGRAGASGAGEYCEQQDSR